MHRLKAIAALLLPGAFLLLSAASCRREDPAPAYVPPQRDTPIRSDLITTPVATLVFPESAPTRSAPAFDALIENPFLARLNGLLASGDIAQAQSLYLSALRDGIQAQRDTYDPIMEALLAAHDYTAARAWAETLLREPLSPSEAATVYRHLFSALIGMKHLDLVASYIPLLVEQVSPDSIGQIMRPACQAAIKSDAIDDFQAIIAALAGYIHRVPKLQPFVTQQQMRMLVKEGRTDKAVSMVKTKAALLPPPEQKAILLLIAEKLVQTHRSIDDINGFAHSVLNHPGLSESARDAVAVWWLDDAGSIGDYNEFLHRFTSVVSAHITPSIPLNALRSTYYEIRQKGTPPPSNQYAAASSTQSTRSMACRSTIARHLPCSALMTTFSTVDTGGHKKWSSAACPDIPKSGMLYFTTSSRPTPPCEKGATPTPLPASENTCDQFETRQTRSRTPQAGIRFMWKQC